MKFLILILSISFLFYSCNMDQPNVTTKTTNSTATIMEETKEVKGKTIAFYNLENLFDIYDDPYTDDDWFTPESKTKWDDTKYQRKLKHISDAISAIQKDNPIIVGLVEVENETVLEDLVRETKLKASNYNIITESSPDERGIDVALLYNSEYFNYSFHDIIPIHFPFSIDRHGDKTRDILYVNGTLNQEEVHILVNHWPSRSEGQRKTEPKRLFVAEQLRAKVESILGKDPNAKILVMGDFNDYPDDKSITKVLRASDKKSINNDELYNLAAQLHKNGKGSYMYKGNWGMIDQMMISKSFLHPKSGIGIRKNTVEILDDKFLMFKHPKFRTWQPNKTYSGPKYHGGYSDHLAIYITLK